MDEVDGGVGLQQVAPGALAGMRATGDEQDPQVLADAFDCDDDAIVEFGEFTLQRVGGEFEDVVAAMRNRHRNVDRGAGPGALLRDDLAIAPHGDGDPVRSCLHAAILKLQRDDLLGADKGEFRGAGNGETAVDLVLAARHQPVQRRVETKVRGLFGDVVDLSVGDHDAAADPLRRHVREAVGQRGEERRAVRRCPVAARGAGDAQLVAGKRGEALFERGKGLAGRRGAVAQPLALALVDDDGDDAGQRFAVLALHGRAGQRPEGISSN